ncbi:DUF262 domain-containing protein [uncultured Maribacter sp.]|uniref:DUF262 domain-containing protein n=1 Tax=uncultured Maribacter sp. TaxID=431308 RepID=UPI00263440D9|nr:DUF262 domain-containing protein [uncultured Maribacter sp.]
MQDQKIELKGIGDLLKYKFKVPPYQRGYRWNKRQVVELLEDIEDFHKKSNKKENEFYCLQPIVVSKLNEEYILIDGQQRLTTIYLILTFLDNVMQTLDYEKFELAYSTRPGSETFLNNIDISRKNENIDFFHIAEAYEVITEWFETKKGTEKVQLLTTLLDISEKANNVRVIWYEITGSEEELIDIFTRINIGKIPLTNSELIKALLLSEQAKITPLKVGQLRQLEIANEWDIIEQDLRNPEFWLFLQDVDSKYQNHIELLFAIVTGDMNNKDPYFTFQFFNNRLKQDEDETVEVLWAEIKKIYMQLKEWYSIREYYHLVGYLILNNYTIKELLEKSKKLDKSDFKLFLKSAILESININELELYTYFSDRLELRNVLILFNIISIIESENPSLRFNFGQFKKQNWDIEHIHSVSSEIPEKRSHQIDWLNEVYEYTKDEALKKEIDVFLKIKGDRDFDSIYNKIVSIYSENGEQKDINDISNLALLDAKTNRGYKNAVFQIKRATIIEKELNGQFIPLCTRNVFLKYYSPSVDQMSFWGNADRDYYLKNLKSTLNNYLIT